MYRQQSIERAGRPKRNYQRVLQFAAAAALTSLAASCAYGSNGNSAPTAPATTQAPTSPAGVRTGYTNVFTTKPCQWTEEKYKPVDDFGYTADGSISYALVTVDGRCDPKPNYLYKLPDQTSKTIPPAFATGDKLKVYCVTTGATYEDPAHSTNYWLGIAEINGRPGDYAGFMPDSVLGSTGKILSTVLPDCRPHTEASA